LSNVFDVDGTLSAANQRRHCFAPRPRPVESGARLLNLREKRRR
jgi:hypothetical protein